MLTGNTRFTATSVAKAVCPPGRVEMWFWDTVVPGFGIRARASGHRTWVFQYRNAEGKTRRSTFKRVEAVPLDTARQLATALLAKVLQGADPQSERRAVRHAVPFKVVVADYLAAAKPRLAGSSYQSYTHHLMVLAKPLHGMAAASVARLDVTRLLTKVAETNGGTQANRMRASLSALFTWALRSGVLDGHNPVVNTPKPAGEVERERVLTEDELALLWAATAKLEGFDRVFRLLMLTGCRRAEVGMMRWCELHLNDDAPAAWVLPRERAKNAVSYEIPFGPAARALLPAPKPGWGFVFGERDSGFSGWSKCVARICVTIARSGAPLEHWTLHDLRRTMATWMSENGVEPHVVEALLNHSSGAAKKGVAGIYNRAHYREPKRAALAKWEAYILSII